MIKAWQLSEMPYLGLQRGSSVNRPVPRHWHDEYQFCFVESGMGDLTYRGKDLLTPPASLFIVHPGEVHSNRAFDDEGCSFRTVFLDIEAMQNCVTQLQRKTSTLPFFPSTIVFDKGTIRRFMTLHRSLEQPSTRLERETHLQDFLVSLIDRFAEDSISLPSHRKESNPLKRACDFMIANYNQNISLDKLADVANLSPFHFNRVFSAHFGMPPHEFQLQIRLSEVKKSLRGGTGIAQAAHQAGFADQSHLTRHFKRVLGITPGQYK